MTRSAAAPPGGHAPELGSALSSGLGLLVCIAVARLFDPGTVGVNAVALSATVLLAGAAHLNLPRALQHLLPVAGTSARRLVLAGYGAAAALAALAGAGFALVAPLWEAEELAAAAGHGPLLAYFVLATPLWALYLVQGSVLAGTGRSRFVLAQDVLVAVAAVVLLGVAAFLAVPGGIAAASVAAVGVCVVTVSGWLLLRELPRAGRSSAGRAVPITVGSVVRHGRAEHAGTVCWLVAVCGLPVIVLAHLGAEPAAAYAVVWAVAWALYRITAGVGRSVCATGRAGFEEAQRATVRRSLRVVVPAAVLVALAAPLVLAAFGGYYAEAAGFALALAALSAIPNVITASTVRTARRRGRPGVIVGVPAGVALLVVALSWLFLPRLGITAVGLAWLVAQSVMATGILVATAPWLPPLLATRIDAARSAVLLRRIGSAPFVDSGIADAQDWALRERLAGGSTSVVVGVGPEQGPGALLKAVDTARGQAELRWQNEVLARLHTDPRINHWSVLVPRVLATGEVDGSAYVVESRLPGEPGADALRDPARRRRFTSSAISTISELHRCTSSVVTVDDDDLRRWVHEPMAVILARLPRPLHEPARQLERELVDGLRGRRLAAGWYHGDYTPGNVLTDPDGRAVAVVDWCNAHPRALPVLDVVTFLMLSTVLADGEELGDLVVGWVSASPPPAHDLVARSQRLLGGALLEPGLLCLLAWLLHVSQSLTKSPQYGANPVWVRRNLRSVVERAPGLLGGHDPAVPQPGRSVDAQERGRTQATPAR
ncbi:phosphotransferase family protein [Pseudonocardia sp. MH-G8]|uniref:phosphotransferase family protein n=1 Tax=Pseudonocardia sp. MH-G8 TaxID=1854588 RepID=UPI00117B476C|nr:aminoglycoside phosphotransferase family protein [Pseudonocardia sp. MH-G8]